MTTFEFAKNKFDEAYENFLTCKDPNKEQYYLGEMHAYVQIMEHEATKTNG